MASIRKPSSKTARVEPQHIDLRTLTRACPKHWFPMYSLGANRRSSM